jgi:glycosyltransferase involved in cell wall biosynthesis
MLTLLDARLGRHPTGIGRYVLNLVEQLGQIAGGEVCAIARLRHRRRFQRLGVRSWSSPPRGRGDARLPAADVVHGPNFHAPAHPSAAAVATIHDLGYVHLPECHPPGMPERLDAMVRASLRHTAIFLCDSLATKRDFVEHYGVQEERCRVVHLGVAERFLATPAAGDAPPPGVRAPYLLHVGAMVPRKDLLTLVEAFELVSQDHPELSLVLAGHKIRRWASDWPKVERWLHEHPDLRPRVKVLDYVRDRDVAGLYAHASAVVTTTLLEGFGLTVLEGLAAGAPVVASRVAAIEEIAGEAIHYGEPRRPETFAHAIDDALRTHDAASAQRGRAVARRYTWRATAEATLAAYHDAAGA